MELLATKTNDLQMRTLTSPASFLVARRNFFRRWESMSAIHHKTLFLGSRCSFQECAFQRSLKFFRKDQDYFLLKKCSSLSVASANLRKTLGNDTTVRRTTSKPPIDIAILSNGPGEVATWVKSVVQSLRECSKNGIEVRISVILAPCPHASGKEFELVNSFEEVDRCQAPDAFLDFLLFGKTAKNWEWRERGVCIFLGGDQFNAIITGWKLGYPTLIYAEEAVLWPCFATMYALRDTSLLSQIPSIFLPKCSVVGDLFHSALSHQFSPSFPSNGLPVIGLLPGSKPVKLSLGFPFFMAAADHIFSRLGGKVQFVLPLAPTVDLEDIPRFISPSQNPFISQLGWGMGQLEFLSPNPAGQSEGLLGILRTGSGTPIQIWREFPVYRLYRCCSLCLTTVGTNTAELGHLAVPMIVALPTQRLDLFSSASGGVLFLLSKLPLGIGRAILEASNRAFLESSGFLSWPNRWAGREVVPELVGSVEPYQVGELAVEVLKCPGRLEQMVADLKGLSRRGEEGEGNNAADTIVDKVFQLAFGEPFEES